LLLLNNKLNEQMKNTLKLLILSLVLLSACGKDDSSAPQLGLSGTVTFDGTSYAIANGVLTLQESGGNAIGQFFLADGTLEPTSSGVSTSDSQIIISVSAVAKGASTLVEGSYATSTDVPDMYADVAVTTADGQKTAFTGGTVTISGSGNTYNLTFNVPFGQGVTLTGSVMGTYANP
jgi:major membrane immunogen (membrane-anchored lipoprotein)